MRAWDCWSAGSRCGNDPLESSRLPFPRLRNRDLGHPDCGFAFIIAALAWFKRCAPPRPNHPVIGAKNFTEQVILGELLAQEIEAHSQLKVERRFYLAGSYICHQALVAGRIDAYVEYTGTALTAILKQPLDRNPDSVLNNCARSLCIALSRHGGRSAGI